MSADGDPREDRADGLSPARPLASIRDRPFVRERIAPEPKPILLGLSPFVAETLALPRNAVGFYLVGLLLVIPLAVYARLHRSTTSDSAPPRSRSRCRC